MVSPVVIDKDGSARHSKCLSNGVMLICDIRIANVDLFVDEKTETILVKPNYTVQEARQYDNTYYVGAHAAMVEKAKKQALRDQEILSARSKVASGDFSTEDRETAEKKTRFEIISNCEPYGDWLIFYVDGGLDT